MPRASTKTGQSTQSLVSLVNDIRLESASIREVVNGLLQLQKERHEDLIKELNAIKEQTIKTNGRVSRLEQKEVLNAVVRYVLGGVGLAALGAMGVRLLSLIGL